MGRMIGQFSGVDVGDVHVAAPPLYLMILSGIAFEFVWLVCVLNPGLGLVLGTTVANVLLHVFLCCAVTAAGSGSRSAGRLGALLRCCTWLALIAGAGIGMDALLFKGGVFIATGKSESFTVLPVWLACLWVNFALALRYAFVFLQRNLVVAAVFGAVGGPLSYFVGAAIGGFVALEEPLWQSLVLLALLWLLFLVGAMKLARLPFLRF